MLHYGMDKPFVPLVEKGTTLIDIEDMVFYFGFSIDQGVELVYLAEAFRKGWRDLVSRYPREEIHSATRKVFASRKIFGGNDPPWVFVCNKCGHRRVLGLLAFDRECRRIFPINTGVDFIADFAIVEKGPPPTINYKTRACKGMFRFSRYDEDNGWLNR